MRSRSSRRALQGVPVLKVEIGIDPPQTPVLRTCLVVGDTRSGKTLLTGGTFPRPYWIGSEREDGHETLRWMDRSLWYERDRPPLVRAVSTIADVDWCLTKEAIPLVERGIVRTIVLELSFYSDDVIRNSDGDTRAKYGALEQHITLLDTRLKKIPGAIVAYNALPDRRIPDVTLPLVAGRAVGPRLPASVSVYAYLRTETDASGRLDRILHLAPYGTVACGHRFGGRLPSFLRNPTYRLMEEVIAGRLAVDVAGNVILPTPLVLAPLGGSTPGNGAPITLAPLSAAPVLAPSDAKP